MKKLACLIVLGVCGVLIPVSAFAETKPQAVKAPEIPASTAIGDFTARLLALNQVSPRQNPQMQSGTRALSRRLVDQNKRGLGQITDITLGQGGKMQSVQADVIATGFDQNMSFDVTAYNVSPESDTYAVTLSRTQIQKNASEFLNTIETAAGEESDQPITITSLVGARVQTDKGTQMAVVNDVLIDEKRKAAVALLLTLMGGSGRTTIAVPYVDARIDRAGSKATVELSEEQARIVSNFARRK